jgi:hypothetical protein
VSTLFYLGSHRPRWLEDPFCPPLFISAHTLADYRRGGDHFPKGMARYAIDSGGFTELRDRGGWTIDADTYGGMILRFMDDIGRPPDFVSPQDWMCEPWILDKTGLTVRDHQELTTENLLYLRAEFPWVPWIPVLQGWSLDDYLRHADDYATAGVDLAAEPLVGLGSVCRRQSTSEIGAIVGTFHARGLRLHGFGVKISGLRHYGHMLASADSMAWSSRARMENVRLDGCGHRGPCNNCRRYALLWRQKVLAALDAPKQLSLDVFAGVAA